MFLQPILFVFHETNVLTSNRLYVPAVITGFKRNLRKQYEHTNLLKLDGVRTRKDARFYLGKRVAYVWKSSTSEGPKTWNGLKVTWGKVTNVHGNSGVVRAKFNRNLPAQSIGKVAKVMLYPSQI